MTWRSADIKVVSFDVFDTVLTRNVYRPHAIFERVQSHLEGVALPGFPASCAGAYAAGRREAELSTGAPAGPERSHHAIMDAVSRELGISKEAAGTLADWEYEEEHGAVVPVQGVVDLIKAMRQAGKRIVFLSDMYLPDRVIAGLLLKTGAFETGDRLYVSGSRGASKASGKLFGQLLEDLALAPEQVIHYGDYLWSDFLVPRLKHGIRSRAVRSARPNGYERIWGDSCRCLYCSSVAGASRAARVTYPGDPRYGALYRIGCNIAGPLLAGFVMWTLREALKAGIRRLYFLSRDGELLLEIARDLAARSGFDIELRYLHVSRTAVFPALPATGISAETLHWLTEGTIVLTPRILADRLKVAPNRLYSLFLAKGVDLTGLDEPVGAALGRIRLLLLEDPELHALVQGRSREIRDLLSGYLEQEGLFDGTPVALVDLGWHGGIQDVIHSCFAHRLGEGGLTGYYFGVDLPSVDGKQKNGFFFSHQRSRETDRFRDLFRILLELFCLGSHGMVRGYCCSAGGRYEPVFGAAEHPENWERTLHLRQGVHGFLRQLDLRGVAETHWEHAKPRVLEVLSRLFFCPSKEEAQALGDLWFSADQAGHGIYLVAPPFTARGALRYLTRRSYATRSPISNWFFASWTRSGMVAKLLLLPAVLALRTCYLRRYLVQLVRLRGAELFNRFICCCPSEVRNDAD